MKIKFLLIQILVFVSYAVFSQDAGIGSNTPDPSAAWDVTTTNKNEIHIRYSGIQFLLHNQP